MMLFYRSFERTAPIWFEKIVNGSADFLEQKRDIFAMASTACIPDIIRMASDMKHEILNSHVQFFCDRLQGLPNRLPSIYSVYRYCAVKVSNVLTFIEIMLENLIHFIQYTVPQPFKLIFTT